MSKTIAEPYLDMKKFEGYKNIVEKLKQKPDVNKAKPEVLIPFMLKWEGGLSRSNHDRASQNYCPTELNGSYYHTNKGITYKTWVSFFGSQKDMRFLVMDHKDWLLVFKDNYWDSWKADMISSQRIANVLAEWVWMSGSYGIKIPQRMLGFTGNKVDGIVGPKTIKKLQKKINSSENDFLARLYDSRFRFYHNIVENDFSQKPNLQGWLNRLNDLKLFNSEL